MMAAYEHNDARDSTRLLACRTLEGLRHRDRAPSLENAINNMYRLLQGFRSHGFYGYVEHAPSEEERSLSAMLSPSDRNVGDVKHALANAFQSAFGEEDPRCAIDGMRTVLRIVAYPEDGGTLDPAEVERTTRFFEALVQNLEA